MVSNGDNPNGYLKLGAISTVRDILLKRSDLRTPRDIDFLVTHIVDHDDFLSHFKFRREVASVMGLLSFPTNHVVFNQGDIGDKFFIVLTGGVSVQVKEGSENPLPDDDENCIREEFRLNKDFGYIEVCRYNQGRGFGELALLSESSRRSAKVITISKTELIVISKSDFVRCKGSDFDKSIEEKILYLKSIPAIAAADIPEATLRSFAQRLREEKLTEERFLALQSHKAQKIFFVVNGSARVLHSFPVESASTLKSLGINQNNQNAIFGSIPKNPVLNMGPAHQNNNINNTRDVHDTNQISSRIPLKPSLNSNSLQNTLTYSANNIETFQHNDSPIDVTHQNLSYSIPAISSQSPNKPLNIDFSQAKTAISTPRTNYLPTQPSACLSPAQKVANEKIKSLISSKSPNSFNIASVLSPNAKHNRLSSTIGELTPTLPMTKPSSQLGGEKVVGSPPTSPRKQKSSHKFRSQKGSKNSAVVNLERKNDFKVFDRDINDNNSTTTNSDAKEINNTLSSTLPIWSRDIEYGLGFVNPPEATDEAMMLQSRLPNGFLMPLGPPHCVSIANHGEESKLGEQTTGQNALYSQSNSHSAALAVVEQTTKIKGGEAFAIRDSRLGILNGNPQTAYGRLLNNFYYHEKPANEDENSSSQLKDEGKRRLVRHDTAKQQTNTTASFTHVNSDLPAEASTSPVAGGLRFVVPESNRMHAADIVSLQCVDAGQRGELNDDLGFGGGGGLPSHMTFEENGHTKHPSLKAAAIAGCVEFATKKSSMVSLESVLDDPIAAKNMFRGSLVPAALFQRFSNTSPCAPYSQDTPQLKEVHDKTPNNFETSPSTQHQKPIHLGGLHGINLAEIASVHLPSKVPNPFLPFVAGAQIPEYPQTVCIMGETHSPSPTISIGDAEPSSVNRGFNGQYTEFKVGPPPAVRLFDADVSAFMIARPTSPPLTTLRPSCVLPSGIIQSSMSDKQKSDMERAIEMQVSLAQIHEKTSVKALVDARRFEERKIDSLKLQEVLEEVSHTISSPSELIANFMKTQPPLNKKIPEPSPLASIRLYGSGQYHKLVDQTDSSPTMNSPRVRWHQPSIPSNDLSKDLALCINKYKVDNESNAAKVKQYHPTVSLPMAVLSERKVDKSSERITQKDKKDNLFNKKRINNKNIKKLREENIKPAKMEIDILQSYVETISHRMEGDYQNPTNPIFNHSNQTMEELILTNNNGIKHNQGKNSHLRNGSVNEMNNANGLGSLSTQLQVNNERQELLHQELIDENELIQEKMHQKSMQLEIKHQRRAERRLRKKFERKEESHKLAALLSRNTKSERNSKSAESEKEESEDDLNSSSEDQSTRSEDDADNKEEQDEDGRKKNYRLRQEREKAFPKVMVSSVGSLSVSMTGGSHTIANSIQSDGKKENRNNADVNFLDFLSPQAKQMHKCITVELCELKRFSIFGVVEAFTQLAPFVIERSAERRAVLDRFHHDEVHYQPISPSSNSEQSTILKEKNKSVSTTYGFRNKRLTKDTAEFKKKNGTSIEKWDNEHRGDFNDDWTIKGVDDGEGAEFFMKVDSEDANFYLNNDRTMRNTEKSIRLRSLEAHHERNKNLSLQRVSDITNKIQQSTNATDDNNAEDDEEDSSPTNLSIQNSWQVSSAHSKRKLKIPISPSKKAAAPSVGVRSIRVKQDNTAGFQSVLNSKSADGVDGPVSASPFSGRRALNGLTENEIKKQVRIWYRQNDTFLNPLIANSGNAEKELTDFELGDNKIESFSSDKHASSTKGDPVDILLSKIPRHELLIEALSVSVALANNEFAGQLVMSWRQLGSSSYRQTLVSGPFCTVLWCSREDFIEHSTPQLRVALLEAARSLYLESKVGGDTPHIEEWLSVQSKNREMKNTLITANRAQDKLTSSGNMNDFHSGIFRGNGIWDSEASATRLAFRAPPAAEKPTGMKDIAAGTGSKALLSRLVKGLRAFDE